MALAASKSEPEAADRDEMVAGEVGLSDRFIAAAAAAAESVTEFLNGEKSLDPLAALLPLFPAGILVISTLSIGGVIEVWM